MREIISFALTLAGLGMLVGLAGNDDIAVLQGAENTIENVIRPLGCMFFGWLIGGK